MKTVPLRTIVLLSLLGLLLYGCAATGPMQKDTVRLDNQRYVALLELCSANNVQWDWDGFSPVITLRHGSDSVSVCLGSALILFNDQVKDLGRPVRIHQGAVMVPAHFIQVFVPVPAPAVAVGPSKPATVIRTIVLDAGHGGKDPGALGKAGLQEKDINLDVARRLKEELSRQGIKVILTRDSDEFIPLDQRPAAANRISADFFVSIHSNASENDSASGFEAYFLSSDHDDMAKAVAIRENAATRYEPDNQFEYSSGLNAVLWDMILNENRMESVEMARTIAASVERQVNIPTRYIKGANFLVLKGARMPAVLVELGYVTNRTEAAQLQNDYYRQMLAEAIAAGIMRYHGQFAQASGANGS